MVKYLCSILFIFSFSVSVLSQPKSYENLLFDAEKLVLRGDRDSARVVLKSEPESAVANYLLSGFCIDDERYDEALVFAERAYSLDEANLWYLRRIIFINRQKSDYEATKLYYFKLLSDSCLKRDFYDAALFFRDYSADDERKVFLSAVERYPSEEEFYKGLVSSYEREEDLANALTYCKTLVSHLPTSSSYSFVISTLLNLKAFSEAEKFVSEAEKNHVPDDELSLAKARYFAEIGNSEKSVKYFTDAVASDFYDDEEISNFLLSVPLSFGEDGELDSLMMSLGEEYSGSFAVNLFLGDWFSAHRKYRVAINFYEEALRQDYSHKEAFISLLNLYELMGYAHSSDSLSSLAATMYPGEAVFYLYEARAFLAEKRYTEAYDALILGESMVLDEPDLQRSFAFYSAVYFFLTNDLTSYESHYAKFLSRLNDGDDVLREAFYLVRENILIERAMELLESYKKGRDISSNDWFSYVYAFALFREGKFSEALAWINKALDGGKNFLYEELKQDIETAIKGSE